MGNIRISFTICMAVMIMMSCCTPMVNCSIDQRPKAVEKWIKKLGIVGESGHAKEKKLTKLHFYFHDLLRAGNQTTATQVIEANMTATSPTFFGRINMMDDPLTVDPLISSELLGYAKGFYATESMEEMGLLMSMAFVFTQGKYNGSSLVVLGHNPTRNKIREMPIVGGSGVFRLATGVVTAQTYFYNPIKGNATIEFDAVVLHY